MIITITKSETAIFRPNDHLPFISLMVNPGTEAFPLILLKIGKLCHWVRDPPPVMQKNICYLKPYHSPLKYSHGKPKRRHQLRHPLCRGGDTDRIAHLHFRLV